MIAIGSLLRPDDVPEIHRDLVRERDYGNGGGGSCIIAPGGKIIATAPPNEETILIASVTLETVLEFKAVIDVGAHYSRPDVLQLHINRRPLERVVLSDASASPGNNNIFNSNENQEGTKDTKNQ